MRLTPPKKIVFYISAALVVLGILGFFVGFLADFKFYLVLAGYVLLFLGNAVKGF